MSRLTTEERKRLHRSEFALPEKREYPIQDENHARDALARVSADGTRKEQERVREAVHKKFPGIKESHEEEEKK